MPLAPQAPGRPRPCQPPCSPEPLTGRPPRRCPRDSPSVPRSCRFRGGAPGPPVPPGLFLGPRRVAPAQGHVELAFGSSCPTAVPAERDMEPKGPLLPPALGALPGSAVPLVGSHGPAHLGLGDSCWDTRMPQSATASPRARGAQAPWGLGGWGLGQFTRDTGLCEGPASREAGSGRALGPPSCAVPPVSGPRLGGAWG